MKNKWWYVGIGGSVAVVILILSLFFFLPEKSDTSTSVGYVSTEEYGITSQSAESEFDITGIYGSNPGNCKDGAVYCPGVPSCSTCCYRGCSVPDPLNPGIQTTSFPKCAGTKTECHHCTTTGYKGTWGDDGQFHCCLESYPYYYDGLCHKSAQSSGSSCSISNPASCPHVGAMCMSGQSLCNNAFSVNGNYYCSSTDTVSCPRGCVDDKCEATATCGNGNCESTETCGTCIQDCSCPSDKSCVGNACVNDPCTSVRCVEKCNGENTLQFSGTCNPNDGQCYYQEKSCSYGCNSELRICNTEPNPCAAETCGNGNCNANCGETQVACPTDCISNVCASEFCGNNVCNANCGETSQICAADCGQGPCAAETCGNDNCNAACETKQSCPADCDTSGGGNGRDNEGFCAENPALCMSGLIAGIIAAFGGIIFAVMKWTK